MAKEYVEVKKKMPSEREQQDFYQNLRQSVHNWLDTKSGKASQFSDIIFFAPDLFHLLTKMMLDNRIDKKSKSMIGAGILYFFAPIDFLPELIVGPGGFADDVVVAVFIVNTLLNKFPHELVAQHWAGDENLLDVVSRLADSGNKLAAKLPAGKVVKRFMT